MDSNEDDLQYDAEGLPVIYPRHNDPLSSLLRRLGIPHANDDCPPDHLFWPERLLERVLSKERLVIALRGMEVEESQANIAADYVVGRNTQDPGFRFLRLMAILILMDRGKEIFRWIHSEILSDANVPFAFNRNGQLLNNQTKGIVQCTSDWTYHECEIFAGKQWRVYTPYFELDPDGHAQELSFENNIVLPWCKLTNEDKAVLSWKEDDRNTGAFGTVRGVLMRKSSHGFTESLEGRVCEPLDH